MGDGSAISAKEDSSQLGVERAEFASPAWFAAIEQSLRKHLAGAELGGRTITISETFTDPPAHLLQPGESAIGWHFRIDEGGVTVARRARADADLVTTVDYQAVLPVARLVYDSTPEGIAEAGRLRAEAAATGSRTGSETSLPAQVLDGLILVHNEMAARTA